MNGNAFKYAAISENVPNNSNRAPIIWKMIDWEKAKENVNRLQSRIVKAVKRKKWNLVKRLQYLLAKSFYAKILAVKKVVSNKGKRTAGVDKETWKTQEDKAKAVSSLESKGYKALPTKRVYIKKSNNKQRPLSIPTMKDRAMQTLQLFSLQPIAETQADLDSYGFRINRGCKDAMERLFCLLAKRNSPKWILEGDIKSCFDDISHKWMEENITMNTKVLRQFIKAGYLYNKKLFPTNKGAIQGGSISPTLANIVLDGLQQHLHNTFNIGLRGKIIKKKLHKLHYVRYADDFVVTAENKEMLEKVKTEIKTFLEPRGLELSEEKTLITNIDDGFDFLGWNIRKYNGKLITKPSKKSVQKIRNNLSETIHRFSNSSQDMLIYKLNQIITGWCNYHNAVCSKKTFEKIDDILYKMLWRWAKRRHPNKGKKWILNRYWKRIKSRKWVFSDEKSELKRCGDVPIVRHIPLKRDKNPYLDVEYFKARKETQKRKRQKAYKRTAAYKLTCDNNNL